MVSDALLRLKSELALTLDADNYACGTYVGYGFTLRALNDKNCIIFNSWARKSALTTKTVDDFFKEYMSKPENSFVKAYKAGEPNISAVLFAGNDDAQAVLDIKRFITDMVKYYSANYYSNACANCNSSIGLSFAKASDGNVKQLCKMCVQSEEDAAEKADMAQSTKPVDSQPVPQPMQQPVPQPMQQPAVNQTQQTANNPVGIYGIPVPVAQPTDDEQAVVTPTTVLPPATSNNSMDSVDPATAPESTGYSTAQSLAELKPPSNSNLPPISGGFSQPANPVMGILGAIIFSLIGCAVWILIGKLGYISYLGGIAMAFSTIFGYHLFGKRFDTLGLIISIVIVLVMVFVSNMFIYAWQIVSEPGIEEALSLLGYEGFFGVFFGLFDLMKEVDLYAGLEGLDSMTGSFIRDLVIGYIISGIATVAIGVSMLKKDR